MISNRIHLFLHTVRHVHCITTSDKRSNIRSFNTVAPTAHTRSTAYSFHSQISSPSSGCFVCSPQHFSHQIQIVRPRYEARRNHRQWLRSLHGRNPGGRLPQIRLSVITGNLKQKRIMVGTAQKDEYVTNAIARRGVSGIKYSLKHGIVTN